MGDNASWLAAAQAAGGQVSGTTQPAGQPAGQPAPVVQSQPSQPQPAQQTPVNTNDPWVKAALDSGGQVQQSTPVSPANPTDPPNILQRAENAVVGPKTFLGTNVEGDTWAELLHDPIKFAKNIPEMARQLINKPVVAPEELMTEQQKQQHPIVQGAAEFAGGLTTPTNAAVMGITGGLGTLPGAAGKIIPRLISAGFSYQMAESAFKEIPAFRAALADGDQHEAERILTHLTLDLAATALGSQHAIAGEQAKPLFPGMDKAIQDYAQKGMDATGRVASTVAGPIRAVAGAVTDATANVKQSLAEKMGFGQDFNELIKNTSEPSKTKNPGYAQKVEAASPFLRDILNKNPDIKTPEDFVQAIYDRQQAVDNQLLNRAKDAQGTAQAQMPGIINRAMANLDAFFKNEAAGYKPDEIAKAKSEIRDFMEQQGALKDPDLFNVERIRQRFNNDTRTVFGQDPGTVPPAVKAAKAATASFLRPEIDQKFSDLGVDGVKEWRQQEANLIDVRDQLELAQKKSEQMGEFSLLKTAIGNAGWPTVLAALGHGPLGLAAEIGKIAKDYVTDYKTNPNTLIRRAKSQAGPQGPSGEPSFGQIPTTKLLPPAPTVTPTRPGPIEPESPQPFIDPTTRAVRLGLLLPEAKPAINISGVRTEPIEPPNPSEITRPGVQPKAENRQLPSAGETGGPNTTEPSTTGVRLHTPSLNMPESSLTEIQNLPAELAPIAEQAKAAAEKNGVEFRGIQQGATPDKDVAIFEHPKYGSVGVKVNDWSPEQLKSRISDLDDRNKPQSEELPTPKSRFAGVSPDSIRAHELGHAVAASLLGAGAESIYSHLHPVNQSKRVAATTKLDFSNFGVSPNGSFPTSSLVEHLGDLATIFMAGGAAQELTHDTPMNENPHMYGDVKALKSLLRDLQYPEDRIDQHVEAAQNRARNLLTPDIINVIKEHAAYREPGTDEKYQISPDRLKNILEQVRGLNEGNNTTGNQERTQRNPSNDTGREGEGAGSTGQKVTAANIAEDDLADRIAEKIGNRVEAEDRAKSLIQARDGAPNYNGIERRAAPKIIKTYIGPERRIGRINPTGVTGQSVLSGE